jgi:hypothetical protein
MSKTAPDHHDAELVLKVYDLRREPVMRESRDAINRDFWPRNEKPRRSPSCSPSTR